MKYEYLQLYDPNERNLNILGASGWELVSCTSNNVGVMAFLKRALTTVDFSGIFSKEAVAKYGELKLEEFVIALNEGKLQLP